MKTPDIPLGRLVYRHVAFTLQNFDKLKRWQRALELSEGRSLTNAQALDRIIAAAPDEPGVSPAMV